MDGVIKIWNRHKVLLADVQLDQELSCCHFLNDFGDLLVGWKKHLFILNRNIVGRAMNGLEYDSMEDCEKGF